MIADYVDSPAFFSVGLGILVLLAAWLPLVVRRLPLSLPIIAMALGYSAWRVPGMQSAARLLRHDAVLEHVTEFIVLIALMGAGLRIGRPLAWHKWQIPFRLLAISMPLTIFSMALMCWALGLPWASALLVGAALAPTDPVLAADVQVGPPGEDEGGEVRFSLTSEAGLNDGLAFPFVILAIALSSGSLPAIWQHWLFFDVAWKIGSGALVGYLAGWAFGWLTFRLPRLELSKTGDGLVAVGVTLVSYGTTELAHGYGFIAVFIAAMTLRATDRGHGFHAAMAEFSEQIERVLMVLVLVTFGAAIASGALTFRWVDAVVAGVMLAIIRPAAGWIGLLGTRLPMADRALVAFFGIRGLGTFYYLAYAMNRGHFADAGRLWAIASFVVAASVFVHGIASTPLMDWADRRRRRQISGALARLAGSSGDRGTDRSEWRWSRADNDGSHDGNQHRRRP